MLFTPLEDKQPSQYKVTFFGDRNKTGIVDLEFLCKEYEGGRLAHAHVFAELFQIRQNSKFKHKDKFDFNFEEWEITFDDWLIFISFLKHGFILDDNLHKLHKLNMFCNKIGGVPAFDTYYGNILNSQIKNEIEPALPSQDVTTKYNWIIWNRYDKEDLKTYYSTGWSATCVLHGDFIVLKNEKQSKEKQRSTVAASFETLE